ncbi:hypothetical protein QTP86_009420 [Hemibagrus guttatus]|nr:hypothetical protein QTP86_009420 [Hemibagrus guttatus]
MDPRSSASGASSQSTSPEVDPADLPAVVAHQRATIWAYQEQIAALQAANEQLRQLWPAHATPPPIATAPRRGVSALDPAPSVLILWGLGPLGVGLSRETFNAQALLDSGATVNLIDHHLIEELCFPAMPCVTPLQVTAVDIQPIGKKYLTWQTIPLTLQIGLFHTEKIALYVLSSPANPVIWAFPGCSSTTLSPRSAETSVLPQEYQDLHEVFSKEKATRLPPTAPGTVPQTFCPIPRCSRRGSNPSLFWVHVIQVDSVQRWMEDLRHMTEVECMCVLQSKPLGVDEDSAGELIIPGVGMGSDHVTRDNLQTLLKRALVVSTELGKMFQRLEKGRWQRVHGTAVRANCHVRSLVHECSGHRTNNTHMQKYEATLLEKCMELTVITERCLHTDDEYFLKSMKEAIHEILTDVSDSFSQMIDMALANEIQVLIRQVEESDDVFLMENAISNLLSLTQDGPQLCSIIAKVDGVLCLADILTDEGCTEAARAEAAAVVAQITSPHHSNTHHLSSFIESMQDIVSALIKLCETASCGEVFLLASAALANITFFDSLACEILLQLNAVHILLQACRDRQRVDTPYSKDQVVTILANLSVLEQTASEVLQENVGHMTYMIRLERLLVLLGEKPSSSSPSEGAACERVQQKAAVTLARLSRDPDVAQAAIELQAVPRLIELCRSPAERNSSDSVLVACLACKPVPMKGLPMVLQTAEALFQHVFHNFGLPEDIVSDRGPQFTSRVWRSFCKHLGINIINLSSGYHPQSNGQAERSNKEIRRFLRYYCSREQQRWSEFLPWAEYALNSLTQSSTGLTPFQCVLGYQPLLFPWSSESSDVPVVVEWSRLSQEVWEHAHVHLQLAIRRQRFQANQH